ncbi:MAG TPA: glycosyltransferase family 4 protein [Candidatus Eisenbacteria bacterium]|nr:glycosyltransferase family 4 protein [Candidatus Eisenbacteria bacterium]
MAALKPRLLVVGPLPPPVGGVETMTQAVLESHAFDAFELAHADITKHRPKETQGRFDAANFAWAARHISRTATRAARFRPDVAYVPVAGNFSAVLRDLALAGVVRRAGARVIGHQHAGDIARTLARRGPERAWMRAMFGAFDRMLLLGEPWRPLLAAFCRCPTFVVPSTFRREVLAAAAAPRPERARELRALVVGQFGAGKGTGELLESLARLRERGLVVPLTIVGPPQRPGDEAAVLARRAALNLEQQVEMAGLKMGEALWREYRRATLFVLPSHAEGVPVVLHEAGAFGLAVVTTPVGAIPDLVRDGANGLLVPSGDVAALADAIERLVGDPALRQRLADALTHDIALFHPDRICARLAGHVRAVLAGSPLEFLPGDPATAVPPLAPLPARAIAERA